MKFETTSILIESLKPYIDNSDITISANDKNQSDIVTIDAENHIGFEVLENKIIVFYFTTHSHFKDYISIFKNGNKNYIERAKAFLKELFEYRILHFEHYKGKTLSTEKYFLMYDDIREDKYLGGIWYGLEKFINPFAKKSMHTTTWQFDQSIGSFSTREPKYVDPNVIEVIDINENCYIEIYKKYDAYTYTIMEMYYADYSGMYYWMPADNIAPSGLYDTKENAVKYAMQALKLRGDF